MNWRKITAKFSFAITIISTFSQTMDEFEKQVQSLESVREPLV